MTIELTRKILDRLARRGWPQWKQQIAFEWLSFRCRRDGNAL